MIDSDDSDARMRGMLLEILIECHRLLDHLLMQLRGIQQMKSVVLPYSKSKMSNVETSLLTGDGNNITVFHGLAHGLRIENL